MLWFWTLYLYAGVLMGESLLIGNRKNGRGTRGWNYLAFVTLWAVYVPFGILLHYWGRKGEKV